MYSVEIAYEEDGKIKKEIFTGDFLNDILTNIRLQINALIPKKHVIAIIILREDP